MRVILKIPLALATLVGTSAIAPAESANHYLATPEKFEGKTVKLDVRVIRPVPWTSPVDEIRFFHAFTEDKKQNALAGVILIAVPTPRVEKFTDDYSMSATRKSETLRGVLLSVPTRSKKKPSVYIIDYEGLCADIIAKRKGITLDADSGTP